MPSRNYLQTFILVLFPWFNFIMVIIFRTVWTSENPIVSLKNGWDF